MLYFKEALPLSLYIHLPWCVKKCPYCDFNSHEANASDLEEQSYVDALIRDIELELPRIWGRTISSIFIGGGTPSLFTAASFDRLLSALRARLNFHPETEITMEVNPGTAEAKKFNAYRKTGINRLSIGVQSFNDENLKALGRIHDSSEALHAIELAKQADFENFNIDLMFGLPKQTIEDALADLETAIAQSPTHISWYQLTIEPNTVFNAKPPVLPNEDVIWKMQLEGQKRLTASAYQQYEVSAYAKKGSKCLHNINYWEFGDYLGIGAGAHGKITNVAEGKVERYQRHKIPSRYMQLAGTESVITETKSLSRNDLSLEFMMNAMRLKEGISPDMFLERTGQPLSLLKDSLKNAEKKELINWQANHLKPTEKGLRYLNELLEIFVD